METTQGVFAVADMLEKEITDKFIENKPHLALYGLQVLSFNRYIRTHHVSVRAMRRIILPLLEAKAIIESELVDDKSSDETYAKMWEAFCSAKVVGVLSNPITHKIPGSLLYVVVQHILSLLNHDSTGLGHHELICRDIGTPIITKKLILVSIRETARFYLKKEFGIKMPSNLNTYASMQEWADSLETSTAKFVVEGISRDLPIHSDSFDVRFGCRFVRNFGYLPEHDLWCACKMCAEKKGMTC